MSKIENVRQLQGEMLNSYQDFKDGKIPVEVAKESCNYFGKIMNASKLELAQKSFLNDNSPVPFLVCD